MPALTSPRRPDENGTSSVATSQLLDQMSLSKLTKGPYERGDEARMRPEEEEQKNTQRSSARFPPSQHSSSALA